MIVNSHIVPDIFHIGYQRTGTTWMQKGLFPMLSDYLIFPDTRQWEIYFATSPEEVKGIYDEFGSDNTRDKVLIESEEGLSGGRFRDYTEMARKIAWVNPDAKILINIRSQYTMFPSLYSLYVKKGGIMPYDVYVRLLLENRKLDYWSLVSTYLDVFPKHKVKIMLYEDLLDDPNKYVKGLLDWIGIVSEIELPVPDEKHRNSGKPGEYLIIQKFFNLTLGFPWITRKVTYGKSRELRNRLQLRSKLSWPFIAAMEKLGRAGILVGKHKLTGPVLQEIEELYSPGNIQLFRHLGRDIKDSGYPGGRGEVQ